MEKKAMNNMFNKVMKLISEGIKHIRHKLEIIIRVFYMNFQQKVVDIYLKILID